MSAFSSPRTLCVGEAMVEFAPIGRDQYQRGLAGDTFNTAWHMAQVLGARAKVGFVTKVGQDRLSDNFVTELRADGLDDCVIGRDPARGMGLYLIELVGVERSFHYWRDSSAARGLAADGAFLQRAFTGAGLIHLSGITLAILPDADRARLFSALETARDSGSRISFDPNIRPRLWPSRQHARDAVAQALTMTDIALPSFDDEAMLWGDENPQATLARFAQAGITEAVVKNGGGVVWSLAGGVMLAQDTPAVADIRDTTGAGDSFNAGYLSARLLGHTPEHAITIGQGFAAEVIRHPGARLPKENVPKIPSLQGK